MQISRQKIPGLAAELVERVGVILKLRQEVRRRRGLSPVLAAARPQKISDLSQLNLATNAAQKPVNIWAAELDALLPPNFLATIPFAQLTHLPRYLKALATRMERAKLNPVKDQERVQQLAPYVAALKNFHASPPKSVEARRRLEVFRWMIEEFKVSLFAQELGTAFPVSPPRLDQQLGQCRDC